MSGGKVYNLEERLIDFASAAIKLCKSLPNDAVANHLAGQLMRSSTSSALNYREAQGAESHKDFIHKIKLVLKELRESIVNMRILNRATYLNTDDPIVKECDELVAIFAKSLITAQKNHPKQQTGPDSKS